MPAKGRTPTPLTSHVSFQQSIDGALNQWRRQDPPPPCGEGLGVGVTPQGMRPRFHPTRLGAPRARLTTLPVEGRVIAVRGKGSPTEETAMNKITRSKDLMIPKVTTGP